MTDNLTDEDRAASDAYKEGSDAFRAGASWLANPYIHRHAGCAVEWRNGYTAAGNAKGTP